MCKEYLKSRAKYFSKWKGFEKRNSSSGGQNCSKNSNTQTREQNISLRTLKCKLATAGPTGTTGLTAQRDFVS